MELSTWLAFFVASWAISLSPGPGALAAMTAGLHHGFRYGYFNTLGLVLGVWTQMAVVGLGLGALLAASPQAFVVLKWVGAAYLVYLGVAQWRAPAKPWLSPADAGAARPTRSSLVMRGWMINGLNPKGTVFILAVVPQFVDLHRALLPQYAVIALTLSFTDAVVMAGYTALAAKVLRLLRDPVHLRWMNRVFGGLFVAAGLVLATYHR